ncbi:Uncharacterised protein [Porphyromonas macacae]|uniref:Uncharacterized protein n=1 Tax=Porphyromonas macacae TaxID=28115 RepID=A0A379E7B7_9PORP|nr:Uncharacterised protein [Porphyromonas macacae]
MISLLVVSELLQEVKKGNDFFSLMIVLRKKICCLHDKILCLTVENSSGKEKKSKLTSSKIHCAKNFYCL